MTGRHGATAQIRPRAWARIFCALAALHLGLQGAADAASDSGKNAAALPVPRFVSLKSDRVNVRGGPTKDHEVTWVYTRAGLPVEITAEFENWRRIRDWEGAEGWVYHSLLSGRRTAVVVSKNKSELVPVMAKPDAGSDVTASLEPGVVGSVKSCSGTWCHFIGEKFDGWIRQERLWGVYPNETID
ncbi:MAG TPA: SH3 domain-containing protein [Pseudorhodoplanes sp.]|jgi:SH3-like domain-containing protein|nr:SH3 domain-containing protein [Pseudorhodoplanes sp.]